MKPTHLKTLSARIDEISSLYYESDDERFLSFHMNIYNYNNFLKQHLTLSQFVPCGADGKPIKDPKTRVMLDWIDKGQDEQIQADNEAYRQAKQNVIFEGWEVDRSFNDSLDYVLSNGEIKIIHYSKENWTEHFFRIDKGFNTVDAPKIKTLADLAAATISNPIKFK